jgi:hypothetical protein
MQHLNTLSQVVGAASTVMEWARSSQTYSFHVKSGASCYVHIGGGEVRIARENIGQIEIAAKFQAPFGWRVAAEQDDAGVYFVALRRAIVGGIAHANFLIRIPHDAYLTLKLEHTRLALEDVSGVFELPPQTAILQLPTETPTESP